MEKRRRGERSKEGAGGEQAGQTVRTEGQTDKELKSEHPVLVKVFAGWASKSPVSYYRISQYCVFSNQTVPGVFESLRRKKTVSRRLKS